MGSGGQGVGLQDPGSKGSPIGSQEDPLGPSGWFDESSDDS